MRSLISRFLTLVSPRFVVVGLLQLLVGLSLLLGLSLPVSAGTIYQAHLSPAFYDERLAVVPPAAERAATNIETAAEDIFKGLDTTKEKIGKTPGRKESIDFARRKASQKLKALADQTRTATENEGVSLKPAEKIVIRHLQPDTP